MASKCPRRRPHDERRIPERSRDDRAATDSDAFQYQRPGPNENFVLDDDRRSKNPSRGVVASPRGIEGVKIVVPDASAGAHQYFIADGEQALIEYYANAIAPLVDALR